MRQKYSLRSTQLCQQLPANAIVRQTSSAEMCPYSWCVWPYEVGSHSVYLKYSFSLQRHKTRWNSNDFAGWSPEVHRKGRGRSIALCLHVLPCPPVVPVVLWFSTANQPRREDQPKSEGLENYVFQETYEKNRLFVHSSVFLKAVLQNVDSGKLPKVKVIFVSRQLMNFLFGDMGPKSTGIYAVEQVMWSQIYRQQSGAGCPCRD